MKVYVIAKMSLYMNEKDLETRVFDSEQKAKEYWDVIVNTVFNPDGYIDDTGLHQLSIYNQTDNLIYGQDKEDTDIVLMYTFKECDVE